MSTRRHIDGALSRRKQVGDAGPLQLGGGGSLYHYSSDASNLGGDEAPEEDALVCGDDAGAKALALELAGRLTNGVAVDAGPLASARALEGMTAVIVNVNKRYKAHAGLRVTGVH